MPIDPKIAGTLRELFASKAGCYPYLLPEARIVVENGAGEKLNFTAKTPTSAALMMRQLVAQDGTGVFDRKRPDGRMGAIYFGMDKRMLMGADQREYTLDAFSIAYGDLSEKGFMQVQHPELSSYQWMGDERIMDKPPMDCYAPPIEDLITILERADGDWRNVNFMNLPQAGAFLRLAVDNGPEGDQPSSQLG